ncbi:hypothetical protein T01_14515, partial [Trichinella spiralis]
MGKKLQNYPTEKKAFRRMKNFKIHYTANVEEEEEEG